MVTLRPVDSEPAPVERDATWLFVPDRPVDSEPTPVDRDAIELLATLRPVDREPAPVDRDATWLFVPDRPVDSDVTPVDNEPTWLVVVDATEYSWLPFTASVEVAVTWPAATFWI